MKRILPIVLSLALSLAWFGTNTVPLVYANSFIVNDTTDDLPDLTPGDGVCEVVLNSGQCTLRAAIMEANARSGDDTITLPASAISLSLTGVAEDLSALGDLDITSNLTINGSSSTTTFIDASALSERAFHILKGNVTISNVTITGGNASGDFGGGILVAGGSLTLSNSRVVNSQAASGGGIALTGGSLNVNFSTIGPDTSSSSNVASANGGGLYVANGTTATVRNSTISFNSAKAGGGVYVLGGGTLTVNSSTISGNVVNTSDVTDGGGGVFAGGTVNLNSVTVANNAVNGANGAGGGLLQLGGTINVRNTLIADNTTPASSPDCSGTLVSKGYNLLESALGCNGLANNVNGDIVVSSITPATSFSINGLNNNGGSTLTQAIATGGSSALAVDHGNPGGCNDGGSNFDNDQRGPGFTRYQNGRCDIGAFEYVFTVGVDPATNTPTFTFTPSLTFTPSPTNTPAPSDTPGPTATNTLLPTATGTLTPSATQAPKIPLFTSAPPTSDVSASQTALAQFAPTMAALTAAAAVPTFTPDVAQTQTAFAILNATATPSATATLTPTIGPTFAFPSETGVLAVSESVGRAGGQFVCGVFLLTASNGTVPENSHFQCNTVASDNSLVPTLPNGAHGFWQTAEIKITGSNGLAIESFTQPLTLCAYYSDSYNAYVGGDASRYTIYTASAGGEWQALTTSPDTTTNRVCTQVDHFSYFRLTGQAAPISLPGGAGGILNNGNLVGIVSIACGLLLLVVVLVVVIAVARRRKPAAEET